MMTISTLFLALSIGGFEGEMSIPKPAGYTVSFKSMTGYPVEASLTFATKTEAEQFAAMKAGHGYAVKVGEAK